MHNTVSLPVQYSRLPDHHQGEQLPPIAGTLRNSAAHLQYASARYLEGAQLEDIAFELDTTRHTVTRMLRDQFIHIRPKGPRRRSPIP